MKTGHPPVVLMACSLAAALLLSGALRGSENSDRSLEQALRGHVSFLASDELEGRGAGTRGHDVAMAYVAAQFTRLGLAPAGTDGFRQPMSFRQSELELEAGELVIRHPGGDVALTMLTDAMVRPAAGETASAIDAPAVFAGFGIHAPEFGYDDFSPGVDVRGKVAVILAGSPATLPATARAHYARSRTADLAQRGAVAVVTVETPAEEQRTPWAVQANRARFPTMRLVEPDGGLFESYPEIRAAAVVSRAAGAALFKHAPKSIDEVFAASTRGEAQAFPLGVELRLAGRAVVTDASSANVLAWLPGTDSALAGEPLVITGHLDHLGIGLPVKGDPIYNGALDNALGTAVILEAAAQLAAGPRLRRPVLFASLTAEEKGLLGAYHLSRHLPPRVRRFAANLNIDMPLLLAPTRDVIALGADHSTLGATIREVAGRMSFTVSPDPLPEEVFFVRSDQYPFVRAGVPALALKVGGKSTDPATDLAALQAAFRKLHYHQPSDDLSLPIDWPSAVAFTQLVTEFVRAVADDRTPPDWRPDDFFGTRFAPKKAAGSGSP